MENKPKILYRGVTLDYKMVNTIRISGGNLYPPNKPEFNEKGEAVVGDENEFGVYMSEDEDVAREYATSCGNEGTNLNENLNFRIENETHRLIIPSVGIIYIIDAQGVNIRKPKMAKYLKGMPAIKA